VDNNFRFGQEKTCGHWRAPPDQSVNASVFDRATFIAQQAGYFESRRSNESTARVSQLSSDKTRRASDSSPSQASARKASRPSRRAPGRRERAARFAPNAEAHLFEFHGRLSIHAGVRIRQPPIGMTGSGETSTPRRFFHAQSPKSRKRRYTLALPLVNFASASSAARRRSLHEWPPLTERGCHKRDEGSFGGFR